MVSSLHSNKEVKLARRLAALILSDEERGTLARWARRQKSSQALALRCRIVMACADGKTNTTVAKELKVTNPTVGKWRSRFVANRLDGLRDEPRPQTRRGPGNQRLPHHPQQLHGLPRLRPSPLVAVRVFCCARVRVTRDDAMETASPFRHNHRARPKHASSSSLSTHAQRIGSTV